MKGKRGREEACPVCQHYHDWENGETCATCGHTATANEQLAKEGALPSEIIPGCLYLGSHDHASRNSLLKALGVSHILNTVPSCPVLYKHTFKYHTVSCLPPDFEECFRFLDEVQQAQGRTLIYCMTGVTRSPTVAIGYLMKLRRWRLAEAYQWVKQRRPKTQLSQDDAQRLQQLELHILGSSSTGFVSADSQGAQAAPQWLSWQDMALAQQPQHAQQPQQQLQPAGSAHMHLSFASHPSSGAFVFGNSSMET